MKNRLTFLALLAAISIAMGIGAAILFPAQAQEEDRMAGAPTEKVADISETYRQLNLFGDVFERVRAQYVEETPDETLIEHAINGMLTSLDPHSGYLTEKDYSDMQVQTRGEFGGLGIEVSMENGVVKVVSPIDDTPAFRAGVQSGDYITHLDDESIIGLSLNEAVDKMRGKVGTPIKLTIRREGVADPIEATIVRDVIKIESVKFSVVDETIGYIRITSFNQNTDTGVKKAVQDFKEQLGDKMQGVVLDMRNNPGGLLDQAIAVSDVFLDKGEIVSTRGRHAQDTKRDNATAGDATDGLPIVVLINSGSASGSEIVAGALQDHHRAIILGTKSFGKGSVQTIIPLPGHGAMRLTTARYYTPSGRSIQAKGIDPDIIVEPAKVEQIKSEKYSEADLPGALDNKKKEKAVEPPPAAATPAPADENAKPETKEGDETVAADPRKPDPEKDYQLSRAIDLIRGVSLYESRLKPVSPVPATEAAEAEAAPTSVQ